MNSFVNAATINQHPGTLLGAFVGDQWVKLRALMRRLADERAARRADAQFLAHAQADPRIMADLYAAVLRHEAHTGSSVGLLSSVPELRSSQRESAFETARRMRMANYY